jgi:hypothetical protein
MPSKEPGFVERLQTAAKAKKAQLEKMRASVPATRAPFTEGQAAQLEAAAARKIRTAERKDADRVGAEQRRARRAAENAKQALAVAEERAAERGRQAQADAALKKDQKAARDAKYAARKARQK